MIFHHIKENGATFTLTTFPHCIFKCIKTEEISNNQNHHIIKSVKNVIRLQLTPLSHSCTLSNLFSGAQKSERASIRGSDGQISRLQL